MTSRLDRITQQRLEKLDRIRAGGTNPYPHRSYRTHTAEEAIALLKEQETAPEAERSWPGICHPAPENESARVANLPLGETVELTGYLYLKIVTRVSRERIVFSFCPAPYESYPPGSRSDWCTIHAWIHRDMAGSPNHVREYGTTWTSVVILDMHGREIRGWTGTRDSRHVRVVGTVVQPYGSATGLGGSHTIEVSEIELLESP